MAQVVVTGAGGALGGAVVEQLLARGDDVFTMGRGDGMDFSGDLTDPGAVADGFVRAKERFTHLDGVVHAVGAYRGGKPLAHEEFQAMMRMMAVNYWSAVHVLRMAVTWMRPQGYGRIVTVGAAAAGKGSAGQTAYNTSKAAVLSLTETVAAELAGSGVTANCLVPTTLDTDDNRRAMPGKDPAGWVPLVAAADVVAFLLSPESAALNGAAVPVTEGAKAR